MSIDINHFIAYGYPLEQKLMSIDTALEEAFAVEGLEVLPYGADTGQAFLAQRDTIISLPDLHQDADPSTMMFRVPQGSPKTYNDNLHERAIEFGAKEAPGWFMLTWIS